MIEFEDNKKYIWIDTQSKEKLFTYIEGEWVDPSTGIVYDNSYLYDNGWSISSQAISSSSQENSSTVQGDSDL